MSRKVSIQGDPVGVHATHCCKVCGCKYRSESCPVEQGTIEAVYDCEDCEQTRVQLICDLVHLTPEEYAFIVTESALIRAGEEENVYERNLW